MDSWIAPLDIKLYSLKHFTDTTVYIIALKQQISKKLYYLSIH